MFVWLNGSNTKPPILLQFRSSKTFIIVTVATAIFTDLFVYGIVVPVLPFALKGRANIDPNQTQKYIAVFLAVYGAALLVTAPIMGWIADKTSSRYWPFIGGLFALAGSTAILCVGSSIAALAGGRVLQGMSASIVWVVGLALLVDTVGTEDVGQAMGYMGVSMSLAMLVAPLLGGVVFASAGYYAVFAMAFGLMFLDVLMRVAMIEKKIALKWMPQEAREVEERKKVEAEDNRHSVATVEMDAGAVDETPSQQTTSKPEDRSAVPDDREQGVSAQPTAEEIHTENAPSFMKRLTNRLPPVMTLLSSRRLLSALFGCIIQATLLTAFDTILPLFVKNTFQWQSTGAGLIFLPIVILSLLGPVVGWLTDKHGPRWYAIAGYTLACPCLILLRLVATNTIRQKILLCALLGLIGFALALVLTPMMAEITYAVSAKARRHPPGHFGKNGAYAQAYSLFNMAWAAGCMIGPLLAGLVSAEHGWGTSTLILGSISMFTVIPTAIWTGGSIFKKMSAKKRSREADLRADPSQVP